VRPPKLLADRWVNEPLDALRVDPFAGAGRLFLHCCKELVGNLFRGRMPHREIVNRPNVNNAELRRGGNGLGSAHFSMSGDTLSCGISAPIFVVTAEVKGAATDIVTSAVTTSSSSGIPPVQ